MENEAREYEKNFEIVLAEAGERLYPDCVAVDRRARETREAEREASRGGGREAPQCKHGL